MTCAPRPDGLIVTIELLRRDLNAKAELPLCSLDDEHGLVLATWCARQDPEIQSVLDGTPGASIAVATHRDSNRGKVSLLIGKGEFTVATFSYRMAAARPIGGPR